jgi:hypothetical protein
MKRHLVICEPWHVVVGDTWIEDRKTVGLDQRCLVRMKLFTIDGRLISRRIGRLGEADLQKVKENLARCLAA